MLNARSERILDDPKSYWNKIKNRRCMTPMTGLYEHSKVKKLTKKVPYFIQLKNQEVLYIPGLYSVVELPDPQTGEMIKRWTFTLITREANSGMRVIHNDGANKGRMIRMLPFELSKKWLDEDFTEVDYRNTLNF